MLDLCFQNADDLCVLFYSTCQDLEMNMFLRIHAAQELYRRDRYQGFLSDLLKWHGIG